MSHVTEELVPHCAQHCLLHSMWRRVMLWTYMRHHRSPHLNLPLCHVLPALVLMCPQDAVDADVSDAVMTSAPGSSAGNEGDSPPSCAMLDDCCSGGTNTAAQQQEQQGPPASSADAAAAVVHPAAAEAAGPHYPGHPPGASLAPLAAAATAPVAGVPGSSAGNSGCSSGRSRQGVLTDAEASHILGSQANLWTEYVSDEATAEYMLLPRLAALAEAVW